MKKILQTFALVAVLLVSHYAQAGTSKRIKPTDPAPQDTSSVRVAKGMHTNLGGEVILTITVLDFNNRPIQGALVSAPCTGQEPKTTAINGIASFNMGTVCGCSNDNIQVTTSKGCYQQIKVNCGPYTVICNSN